MYVCIHSFMGLSIDLCLKWGSTDLYDFKSRVQLYVNVVCTRVITHDIRTPSLPLPLSPSLSLSLFPSLPLPLFPSPATSVSRSGLGRVGQREGRGGFYARVVDSNRGGERGKRGRRPRRFPASLYIIRKPPFFLFLFLLPVSWEPRGDSGGGGFGGGGGGGDGGRGGDEEEGREGK